MTIETKAGRYFSRQWFASVSIGDMMCVLYKDTGDNPWVVLGRVRIHMDDKHLDSKDLKQWFRCETSHDLSEEGALAKTEQLFTGLLRTLGEKDDDGVVRTEFRTADQDRVIEILGGLSFVQGRIEGAADA